MAVKLPANLHYIFRQVVTDHGVERLANAMGISPGVLYNKINIDNPDNHNKPSFADAILVTTITKDTRILKNWCFLENGVFVPLSDKPISTDALILHLTQIQTQSGHFHGEIDKALRGDGRIDNTEIDLIEASAWEYISVVLEALERMKEMARD